MVVDDSFSTSQALRVCISRCFHRETGPKCLCEVSEGTSDGRMVSFSRGGNLCYLGAWGGWGGPKTLPRAHGGSSGHPWSKRPRRHERQNCLFFERQAAAKLFGKGLGMALKS